MDFLRQSFGNGAAAAAAQFGDFVSENFQVPLQQQQQFQQQFQQHFQQQQQGPAGPPPTSSAALRQLPLISVTADDLVDPSNRECCICFEEHNIHDKVVRLPCAHIYHAACITDWLQRHCTCPTCRYELPTDDAHYEAGRRERMKTRKPRYAKYELQRMSIRELKSLLPPRRRASALFGDKDGLIDHIIASEAVDIISAPPPVEFPSLAVLRAMGVGQLKRTMNDTGVYYDPRDIVEKEDMIQLFVNSGRIILTQQSDTDDNSGPDTAYGHAPCHRQRSLSIDDTDVDLELDDGDNNVDEKAQSQQQPASMNRQSSSEIPPRATVVVETVGDSDDEDGPKSNSPRKWGSSAVLEEYFEQDEPQNETTTAQTSTTWETINTAGESTAREDGVDDEAVTERSIEVERTVDEVDNVFEGDAPGAQEIASTSSDDDDPMDVDVVQPASEAAAESEIPSVGNGRDIDMDESETQRKRQRVEEVEEKEEGPQEASNPTEQFADLSISQLRALARERGIDISMCIERGEMIDRLVRLSSGNGATLDPDIFQSWSVSQLRACGDVVKVDFRQGASRQDMVDALLIAAATRPQVHNYIVALSPLMVMSLPQLRSQAREWRIDVYDCLEKGDIIKRLAGFAASRV